MNLKIIWMASYHFYLDYEILLRIHLICPNFFFLSLLFWTREKLFCVCCDWIPSFQTTDANFAICNPSSNAFRCIYDV